MRLCIDCPSPLPAEAAHNAKRCGDCAYRVRHKRADDWRPKTEAEKQRDYRQRHPERVRALARTQRRRLHEAIMSDKTSDRYRHRAARFARNSRAYRARLKLLAAAAVLVASSANAQHAFRWTQPAPPAGTGTAVTWDYRCTSPGVSDQAGSLDSPAADAQGVRTYTVQLPSDRAWSCVGRAAGSTGLWSPPSNTIAVAAGPSPSPTPTPTPGPNACTSFKLWKGTGTVADAVADASFQPGEVAPAGCIAFEAVCPSGPVTLALDGAANPAEVNAPYAYPGDDGAARLRCISPALAAGSSHKIAATPSGGTKYEVAFTVQPAPTPSPTPTPSPSPSPTPTPSPAPGQPHWTSSVTAQCGPEPAQCVTTRPKAALCWSGTATSLTLMGANGQSVAQSVPAGVNAMSVNIPPALSHPVTAIVANGASKSPVSIDVRPLGDAGSDNGVSLNSTYLDRWRAAYGLHCVPVVVP